MKSNFPQDLETNLSVFISIYIYSKDKRVPQ